MSDIDEGKTKIGELENVSTYLDLFTREQLFKLNRKEQEAILKSKGVKPLPHLEKDRVDLIIKHSFERR